MNLISMGKKYRRRGGTEPVRLLCVDAIGRKPVVFLDEKHSVVQATISGCFYPLDTQNESDHDLVEYIEPKMVPLGLEDIPIGSALKHKTQYTCGWCLIRAVDNIQVTVEYYGLLSYGRLFGEFLINRNDGKGWVACEKPAQE